MPPLPDHVREVILKLESGLKEFYGDRFRGLLLYGSYARGDAREGSDVDLLLLLKGPVDPVREIIESEPVTWPLSLDSGLVLSVMPADDEAYRRGEGLFLSAVRNDAVPVAA
jgi:predicted nucleotidyltransferase